MAERRVLGIVLAGGAGKRLAPLTEDRAKPAVPFAGLYRLVDFALSNLVNAGFRRICVLTQYKSHSLDRHITTTWQLNSLLGNYVTPVPAQQRLGPHWYTGSADAIYQSLNLIYDDQPDIVAVFGADHVFRMDPMQMIDQHVQFGAGVTVAAIPVPRKEATAFGVIQAAPDGRTIEAFLEKPADPPALPGRPDEAFASMGIYVFDTSVLIEALRQDASDLASRHDMGGDIIPMLVGQGRAQVYDFLDNKVPGVRGPGRRLLARRGNARLLFRCPHGPVRRPSGLQPLQRPVADPDPRALPAARQIRARQGRPDRARHQQHRQQRRHRLGRAGARLGSVARGTGEQLVHGGAGQSCCTTPTSAAMPSSKTRSWTRTSSSPRAPRSAWTRSTTRRAAS